MTLNFLNTVDPVMACIEAIRAENMGKRSMAAPAMRTVRDICEEWSHADSLAQCHHRMAYVSTQHDPVEREKHYRIFKGYEEDKTALRTELIYMIDAAFGEVVGYAITRVLRDE